MAWVSLNNLTRFYTKLKEKFYLKTEIDTKVNTLNSNINTKSNKSDVLSLEEIQASTDLSGKIASANSIKELKGNWVWNTISPTNPYIVEIYNEGLKLSMFVFNTQQATSVTNFRVTKPPINNIYVVSRANSYLSIDANTGNIGGEGMEPWRVGYTLYPIR